MRPLAVAILMLLLLAAPVRAGNDELIVFVAPDDQSAVASEVRTTLIPTLEILGNELDLTVRVVDVTANGAPSEITITPLVVLQTSRGRSIYSGRYSSTDRIRNFITTARIIPQNNAPTVRESLPVWTIGETTIATPIKITTLNGTVPSGFDEEAFRASMSEAIASGMQRFALTDRVAMDRSDRAFYIDFHPYRDANGTLFVSFETYSQFNCHDPIFSRISEPVRGDWDNRDAVFAEASSILEAAILERINSAQHGDGYDVVVRAAGSNPPAWDELDLPLPDALASDDATITLDPSVLTTTTEWSIDEAASARAPQVIFRFPAPLDNYSGQVPDLAGALSFTPASLNDDNASGRIVAHTPTITMGEPMLDETIRGSMILNIKKHTESFFTLEGMAPASSETAVSFGTQTPVFLKGQFTMRGITIPLDVLATLEPVVNGDGKLRMILSAEWSIRLIEPCGIEGPDGPAPENDTVLYAATIVLKPATGGE